MTFCLIHIDEVKGASALFPTLDRVPRPVPAYRKELPGVFNKANPESLADLRAIEKHIEVLVKRLSPAVLAVEVGNGTGSGVIVSPDGLVLTAGHVCGRPNRDARFTLPDGKTARGKTLGLDRERDTGLMKITDPGPWPYVAMGDLDQARLGDWVLALGQPGGFDPKRSLVVRLGRIIRMADDALQTDCPIAPGDSGGPLFDMHGRVIGIHSAISRSLAENFHVSITEFYDSWEELARGERWSTATEPPRAWAGASVEDSAKGCKIISLEKNGPALNAGLKPGDLVLKIDQHEIKSSAAFQRWLAEAHPGDVLNLEIKRGARLLSLSIKVQAQPATGQ